MHNAILVTIKFWFLVINLDDPCMYQLLICTYIFYKA